MSITEKIKEKCADKVYDTAVGVSKLGIGDCMFFVWYEPEFIEELIEEEE